MALNFDPTATTTTAQHLLGEIQKYNGAEYQYVKNNASGVAVVGTPAYADASAVFGEVGKDADSIGTSLTAVLGVHVSAIAAASYGWVLKRGYYDALVTDTNVAAGNSLYVLNDTFGVGTLGTDQIVGWADADDATALGSGYMSFL